MNKCVIVIPVHDENPLETELSSFKQCFHVFSSETIIIVAPEDLNLKKYYDLVPDFKVIRINPSWQQSLLQYNRLKTSLFFYELFKDYEYMLTYELDAWVFRNELEYWCKKKYDYIGAPWFEGFEQPVSDNIIGVGNSGFSLRNISKCIQILKRVRFLKRLRTFWFRFKLQSIWRFPKMLESFPGLFKVKSDKYLNHFFFDFYMPEDGFWCKFVLGTFTDFNISEVKDAIKFSFELNPYQLYKLNNYQLPFGCHAWARYEPEFWKEFIHIGKINH